MTEHTDAREWMRKDGSTIYKCLVLPEQIILTVHIGDEPVDGYIYSREEFLKGIGRGQNGQDRVQGWFSEKILEEIIKFLKEK